MDGTTIVNQEYIDSLTGEIADLREALARATAAEAEVARLKLLPQMISDAVWQYCERDEDGCINPDDVSGIIAKIAGDGSVSDDSLWFTGEQWGGVVGKLDEAVAEVARLRDELADLLDVLLARGAELGYVHDEHYARRWSALTGRTWTLDE